MKFYCKVLSLYLREEIFIFSYKVLFLEIGWFNFQENIVVLVRRLKFFSAGFCIFQLVTCGGEVIFHILSWKSNFVHMRKISYWKKKKKKTEKQLLNTMKLQIFMLVGNSINKNRVVMVSKGFYNVIYFSIISNFYICMYPLLPTLIYSD